MALQRAFTPQSWTPSGFTLRSASASCFRELDQACFNDILGSGHLQNCSHEYGAPSVSEYPARYKEAKTKLSELSATRQRHVPPIAQPDRLMVVKLDTSIAVAMASTPSGVLLHMECRLEIGGPSNKGTT